MATSYLLEAGTLVQTVEHGPGSAYPVVADPNGIWGWAVCISAVTAWLAVNATVGLKFAQLVRKFGSIRRVIEKAIAAYQKAPKNKKRQAVVNSLGAVAGELLGVEAIRSSCFS